VQVPMEDSLRKQAAVALERLGRKYPAMRLGQIVCLAAFLARGPAPNAAWEVTDEELLRSTLEHLAGHPNP
jgi:hypothetical protein